MSFEVEHESSLLFENFEGLGCATFESTDPSNRLSAADSAFPIATKDFNCN
mgnify:CR=1 FL=1